jgi:hypothetical protein
VQLGVFFGVFRERFEKRYPHVLSDRAIRTSKPREKPYKLYDSGGLHVLVQPSGSKLWRLKYRFVGKEKLISFGAYPDVSLASAREKRDDAKKQLASSLGSVLARSFEKDAGPAYGRVFLSSLYSRE